MMTKRTITIWLIWGAIAMIPGAILILASALAFAAHLETVMRGNRYNFLPDEFGCSW